MNSPLNLASERAVLAGLCQYGIDVYNTVCEILSPECFTNIENSLIYHGVCQVLKDSTTVDIGSLLSTISNNQDVINNKPLCDYIKAMFVFNISSENVVREAKILKKLQIARNGQSISKSIYTSLADVTGEETFNDIISKIETPIFEYTSSLTTSSSEATTLISDGIDNYISSLESGENTNIGIPSPFPSYNYAIGGGRRRGSVYLIAARPKCLDINTKVCTPDGHKPISELIVGDIISHPKNVNNVVTKIYPIENRRCYEIIFEDGDIVRCSDEHIWLCRNKQHKYQELTTKDILNQISGGDKYPKVFIDTSVSHFNTKALPIHPYLLGVLIGDGSLHHVAKIHSADYEIISKIKEIQNNKVCIDYDKGEKCIAYRINGYRDALRKLGLFQTNSYIKFIPHEYLHSSYSDRLELLRGLLDTDGDCTYNSSNSTRIRYSTVNHKLAVQVKYLISSMGGIVSINNATTTCNNKRFQSYRLDIRFTQDNPFSLTRKAERVLPRRVGIYKKIKKIVEHNYTIPMVDIEVSADDGLFLIENFLTTHNCGKSTLAVSDALHVSQLGIPVLYLDTEMTKLGQYPRILAKMSNLPIETIESGSYHKNDFERNKVRQSVINLKNNHNFFYRRIARLKFEEIMSIIRRFVFSTVGTSGGAIGNCLIIYDYFKLMDSSSLKDMREDQVIGFQMQDLTDFCNRYEVPCSAFVQMNRQGVDDKSTTTSISQSDRLLWFCSSLALLKRKTAEEISLSGVENGNTKLIVTSDQRYGPGLELDDYINLQFDKEKSVIREIGLKSQMNKKDDGFTDGEPTDEDFNKFEYGD